MKNPKEGTGVDAKIAAAIKGERSNEAAVFRTRRI